MEHISTQVSQDSVLASPRPFVGFAAYVQRQPLSRRDHHVGEQDLDVQLDRISGNHLAISRRACGRGGTAGFFLGLDDSTSLPSGSNRRSVKNGSALGVKDDTKSLAAIGPVISTSSGDALTPKEAVKIRLSWNFSTSRTSTPKPSLRGPRAASHRFPSGTRR